MVKNGFGQIGLHKVDGNHAAVGKGDPPDLERVELAEIEHAMVEMYLENQFVAHREVDVLHQAIFKMNRAECRVIDLCARKMTILEGAIDKGHADEIARRKIAALKSTAFKLTEIQAIATVSNAFVMLLQEVCRHPRKNKDITANSRTKSGRIYPEICVGKEA